MDANDGCKATAIEQVARLYERDHASLVRFVEARSRAVEAEDIVQEAFRRLVQEALAAGPPERPTAWLYQVAANLAVSEWRHAEVARRTPPSRPVGEDEPDVVAIRRETSAELHDLLSGLAPDARLAIVMSARGHRGPEIAGTIGRTELATRALLWRTRARLRHAIAARHELRPGA